MKNKWFYELDYYSDYFVKEDDWSLDSESDYNLSNDWLMDHWAPLFEEKPEKTLRENRRKKLERILKND